MNASSYLITLDSSIAQERQALQRADEKIAHATEERTASAERLKRLEIAKDVYLELHGGGGQPASVSSTPIRLVAPQFNKGASIRFKVISAFAARRSEYLVISNICAATGLTSDQVRPTVRDAVIRGELEAIGNSTRKRSYRLNEQGLRTFERLKTENTQAGRVGNAA